jgi:hypothetical protein
MIRVRVSNICGTTASNICPTASSGMLDRFAITYAALNLRSRCIDVVGMSSLSCKPFNTALNWRIGDEDNSHTLV